MRRPFLALAAAFALGCTRTDAREAVPEVAPYPLPAESQTALSELAGTCNLLVLGEVHGTKEVPAVVEALLAPLTKLGYRAIALEVPHDDQPAIAAWATGKSQDVPPFFAKPGTDGRGNLQVLAMVRRATSPPFRWKLICFDQSEAELQQQVMDRFPKDANRRIAELAHQLSPDDMTALAQQRDAAMAKNLAEGQKQLSPRDKVLVLCGNFHARTANHAPADSAIAGLWPSFAAIVKRDHPEQGMTSVNVQPFSGEYYNGGKVNNFDERPLARVEARATPDDDWDWELNLPRATAATFLEPPADYQQPDHPTENR